jgi:hypothetical protein
MGARLGVRHLAWLAIGVVFATGAICGARQSLKAEALERAIRNTPPTPAVTTQARPESRSAEHGWAARLEAFRAQLGDSNDVEKYLRTIFDKAASQGLMLTQGRYQIEENGVGAYQTVRIELPVTGRYVAVRSFAEEILLAMPHAALESIQFRRESARDNEIKAQLNFNLYLDSKKTLRGQDVWSPAAK